MDRKFLVGAHMSTAGGVHKAPYEAVDYHANIMQIFTVNQRQWIYHSVSDEEISLWEKAIKETHIDHVMSHDSYLINLGSPKKDILEKSRRAFKAEIDRCRKLKIPYLNFHPGAFTTSSEEECLNTIIESLLSMEKEFSGGHTKAVIETTAGQGTAVGYKFEHLKYIIDRVKDKIPVGITIDTCHIFAAGYDIRTAKAWEETLNQFDKIVGLKFLEAFHANDSEKPFGSRVDRHAPLGKGYIGLESFKFIMTHPKLKYLPKYLETPFCDNWGKEIELLLNYAK